MTEFHNIQKLRERRKELRNNSTPQEDLLWKKLKNNALGYKFRRQHSIGSYVVDFYCARTRLVVEIDGGYHSRKEQKKYDKERDEYLSILSHKVLRFTNDEIEGKLDRVLNKIHSELRTNTPSPNLGEGEGGEV